MVGRWCAEFSYLEVFQTNRIGKENDLEINGLWCPNLRPKDLILIWATSEGNNHWCQTPKHTPIYELFIHLGAGGKVGWDNSGWGYPGSLLQADQEYFWVQLFCKNCLTSFHEKSETGPTLLIFYRKAVFHLHFTLMTPGNVRQALAQSQHMVVAARTPFHWFL